MPPNACSPELGDARNGYGSRESLGRTAPGEREGGDRRRTRSARAAASEGRFSGFGLLATPSRPIFRAVAPVARFPIGGGPLRRRVRGGISPHFPAGTPLRNCVCGPRAIPTVPRRHVGRWTDGRSLTPLCCEAILALLDPVRAVLARWFVTLPGTPGDTSWSAA